MKKLNELFELTQKHPELDVIFMVNYEICSNDEHKWWLCDIVKIEICEYWCPDEHVYLDDEIESQIEYSLSCEPQYKNLLDDDFKEAVDIEINKMIDSGEILKKIIVYLDA